MPPKQSPGLPQARMPSMVRREELVRALYNRVAHPLPPRQPEVFDQDLARRFLVETRYDIDQAEDVWRRHSARIRRDRQIPPSPPPVVSAPPALPAQPNGNGNGQDDQSPAAPDSSSESEDSGSDNGVEDSGGRIKLKDELLSLLRKSLLPFSSGEQERRDAALAFRETIKEEHYLTLSISEAVLLLQLEDWDIGLARDAFRSHEVARRRLRYNFDGLRELANVEDKIQESKCLQLLAEITRRSDWLSLKLALERANWNLVKVIIRWFKKGLPVFKDSQIPRNKKTTKGWGQRTDRWGNRLKNPSHDSTKPAKNNFTGWATDSNDFTDANVNPNNGEQPKPHIWGQQWRDDMEEAKKSPGARDRFIREYCGRQPGYLLSFDPQPLKPGAVAPSDFRLEWFAKGQYWFKIFNKSQFDHGRPPSSSESSSFSSQSSDSLGPSSGNSLAAQGQPPAKFDSNNAAHVGVLNRWRGNTRWTAGQFKLGERFQKWTMDELDFLYQLQAGRLAEYKKEFPWMARRELLEKHFQMPKSKKEEWELAFNKRFEGTILAGEQFPRRPRKAGAILEHRTRFPRLATHFRIPLDKEWSEKLRDSDKEAIEKFKQERDELEAEDEQATMDWNEANPTTDGQPRPRPPPKPKGNQRTGNKRAHSSGPPAPGNGNNGQDPGDGSNGGNGGAATGTANGADAGSGNGRGRGSGRGRGGNGAPRCGGGGGRGGSVGSPENGRV